MEMDTDEKEDGQKNTDEPPSQQKGWRLTLEPELLAACFTFSLADGILTLLILQQSCLVRLGYSKETCAVLGTQTPEGEELEGEVQKVAAEVIMWKSLLLNVFPTLAMFFVGPWTDINGRKPVIIAGMSGCTLMYTFYLILSLMLSYAGCLQVEFLFLRIQFSWSYNQFTFFSAYATVAYVIGIYIGNRLLPKRFGVSDITVAIVGCLLASARYLLTSLAGPEQGYFVYIEIAIGFLGGAYAPALRAILSRVVPPEDLGKVFTLTNSFESLSAVASSPIYTYLYTSSLVTFPGVPFLVSSIINFLVTILICIAAFLRKKPQYVPVAVNVDRDHSTVIPEVA